MIGLDVTHRAGATPERVAAIRAIGRPAAETVAAMLALNLEPGMGEGAGGKGAALHDPCVIAWLLRPALFESAALCVEIETADAERLGQTVVNKAKPANATVAQGIDADGFYALLTERLGRL